MPEREKIPFLTMFQAWKPEGTLFPVAEACAVMCAEIGVAVRTLNAQLVCPLMPGHEIIAQLEQGLSTAYGLSQVQLCVEAQPQELTIAEEPVSDWVRPDAQDWVPPEEPGEWLPPDQQLADESTAEDIQSVEGAERILPAEVTAEKNVGEGCTQPEPASSMPIETPLSEQLPQAATVDEVAAAAFRETEAIRQNKMKNLNRERSKSKPKGGVRESKKRKILGQREIRREITPMGELMLELGTVAVKGDVFCVDHRELKKRNSWVISFDITDYSGSIRVSKFYPQADDAKPIVEGVKKGQHLLIEGRLNIDRYTGDMVLEPMAIVEAPKVFRADKAVEKRVELHLHTRMSAMDALTDTKAVVKRAEEWGHRAIAITDHGVAQSFPDAWHAAKEIKVLYGVEAYYINDVDDRVVVHGEVDQPFSGEVVCFDIETTGLDKRNERITEIGAVMLRNGEVAETFNTFVNPEKPLSREIVELTGITDQMLEGAPSQAEAITAFLNFAGDRPLAAHNAEFDMGFISEGCRRAGLPFRNSAIDTLVLAQNLLPNLGKYKLDIVAGHLNLPAFNHHRASDDASTVAYMLIPFFRMLEDMGLHTLGEINPAMTKLRGGGKAKRQPRHLIVLAKNQHGLRNLYKLISQAHLDHFKRFPIMPKSLINAHREGLVLGSACEAGELYDAVYRRKEWPELKRIASWYDFLEIQPLCNNAFMLRKNMVHCVEELKEFNRTIVTLGREMDKPVCATGDVHFLEPEDEIYRHILLATKGFDDADASLPIYFKTTDEMLEEFSYLGKEEAYNVVVRDTNLVADWCERVNPLPKGLFAPKLEDSAGELERLVWGKATELYGENPPQLIVDRINTELGDIINCKYDVIYMSAQKLVQDSLEHGYLVGSRGSVGSSMVAFLAGITEVNSLPAHYRCPQCKHTDFEPGKTYGCGADMPDEVCPHCGTQYVKEGFNIPFETFLGFGGDKVPDIDLNFSGEYQAKSHRYTFELFGESHVFRAGTVGTVAEKTAFGYVKKYLQERNYTVTRAEENRLALGCTGVKRTTGQHPGGMVVIPQNREIYDFCPVQHPADDTSTDIITTHFEYHAMESNLLKLDMLGHDDPSMIRMLEDLTGVNAREIKLDDPGTMSIFTSSKALGFVDDPLLGPTGAVAIPEFGTSFVRGMLMDTQPSQFDILVRLSGFSHGTDVWLGNAKDLIVTEKIPVNQAIGCRDDIMLFLISKGIPEKRAFKIMEAVRKGKGLPEGAEEEMLAAKVPDWYVDSCKKIKYLFPKAHAVAYVMMAFRIAWFKVHRPLAFYAAYFSIRAKAFDSTCMCRGLDLVKAKIREIKSKEKEATAVEQDMLVTLEVCYEFYIRGLTFKNVDLYNSEAILFKPCSETELIPPFASIPGLGETAAVSIAEQRKGKQFISIEEFSAACPKVSKTHIEQLKAAGTLDGLPETSQITFF